MDWFTPNLRHHTPTQVGGGQLLYQGQRGRARETKVPVKRRRRMEITIQRREVAVLRPASIEDYCARCYRTVTLLSLPLAAKAAGVSTRTLYRWMGEDRIHFCEFADGMVRICENSLPR